MSGAMLFTFGALAGFCFGAALAWFVRSRWDAHRQPDPYDGSAGL